MDEYIKREDALNALLSEMVGTGYQARAMDAIKFIPFADVVPKSEVEKFAEDIKLEFYREFDEIITSIMADKIEEFKKKYTEGEDKPASEEKYFSPEDVRKMTNQEVREKYTAIRRSMERW